MEYKLNRGTTNDIEIAYSMNREQFYKSEKLKQVFEPFSEWQLTKYKKIWDMSELFAVYVQTANPNINYGLPFSLYRHFEDVNGVERICEVECGYPIRRESSIVVEVIDTEEGYFISDTGWRIPKTRKGRMMALKKNYILM